MFHALGQLASGPCGQQVGNMRGVEGSTAKLYTITPANVRDISRHYWVRAIDLAPDDRRN